MPTLVRSRHAAARRVLILPLMLVAVSGCDIITADFKSTESSEWRKTYQLQPGGSVEVSNVNGRIEVQSSPGNTVEIVAIKTAKGATSEAAKAALDRIEIVEDANAAGVRVETRMQRGGGMFHVSGGGEVRYIIKVPPSAEVRFTNINGGIELAGLAGRVNAATTNGGVRARDIAGPIDASATNGGVDVELARVAAGGVKLECTNGGIKLRLPADAKATISASITNGGIDAEGLSLDTSESSRRQLEGRLNGGGPSIRIRGTNGGIRLGVR